MLVQPYLYFGGNCQEAIEFYRDALASRKARSRRRPA